MRASELPPRRHRSHTRAAEVRVSAAPVSHDLLRPLLELSGLLVEEVHSGSWLNAYLLAAGVNQVIEDYLHSDPLRLGELAAHLRRGGGPQHRAVAGTCSWLAQRAQAIVGRRRKRASLAPQETFSELVDALAGIVVA